MKAEHKQRMLDLNRHMGMCMLSVLLLITSVFLYFGYRIDKQIEHSTHQRIEEYAVHQRTYISSVLQSRYSLLESFAMYFKDDLLRSKEEFERLSRTLMLAGDFDDILTIDNNGNYRISNGMTGKGDNAEGRQQLLAHGEAISRPFQAFFRDGELCVLLSVPLDDSEGTPAGMLCACYTAQRFGRLLLQDNYRDAAYSLLTDGSGNLLFCSSKNDLFIPDQSSEAEQRYVPSPTFFDEEHAALVRESMRRREDNLYTVSRGGTEYVVVQTPIESNNWFLFCMIPTDSLASDYVFITNLRHIQMVVIILILMVFSMLLILLLVRDWRRLRRENSVLAVRAETDSMTGLLNQATTSSTISSELCEHAGEGLLLLIDLDNLKGINDTLGHPIGDSAILVLSDLMRSVFASAKVIGRIGGDEFMVYMSRPGSREEVRRQIEDLRERMSNALCSQENLQKQVLLHCSIGAAYAREGDDYHSLYTRADIALYHVKRRGKDGYSFFEDIA